MLRKHLLLLAALCCATILSAAQFNGLKSIQTGGKARQYYLYVPDYLPLQSPLMISCHGMNQDYNYQMQQTQWPSMADTARFVVVYPVGIAGSTWGQAYNTGWDLDGMSDVNFMLDIINEVKAEYNIDDTRVYMSGFSLGAAFTYYMANKAADKIAAFAPISGYNLMGGSTAASRPIPIIHVHGTADNTMNYSGVKDYIKRWAQAQKCNMTPVETVGNGYSCTRYTDGDCETEVVLYSVNGRGHEPTNTDFHTSKAIWAFCKQYSNACGKISTSSVSLSIDNDYHFPATVTLTAEPKNLPAGVSVSSIDFYQDKVLLGSVTTEPYQFTVENLYSDDYEFAAVLTDSRGISYAASQSIRVNNSKEDRALYIQSGGKKRNYYLYLSNAFKSGSPLVISCHGMDQEYEHQNQTQWRNLADTAGFALVFPIGTNGHAWVDYSKGWDPEGTTDVDFMLRIIDDVAEYVADEYSCTIDKTRVYLSGYGVLGGDFVYHAINLAANHFAAFAPVNGYTGDQGNFYSPNTTSDRPVPIIHIHGTENNIMPYDGLPNHIRQWALAQNCNSTPEVTTGEGYTCTRYTDGDCETEVVLYAIEGRGYEETNEGFHTTNAIWSFFRQYSTACGKLPPEQRGNGTDQGGEEGGGGEEGLIPIPGAPSDQAPQLHNRKLLHNGQLLILHNGQLFTPHGHQLTHF